MMFELSNTKYPPGLVSLLLKSAVSNGLVNVTKLLLRRCADPNFNIRLLKCAYDNWLEKSKTVRIFTKFDDELSEIIPELLVRRQREILHSVLMGHYDENYTKDLVESLLRSRGTSPNSVNAQGKIVLHFVCQRDNKDDYDLVEAFFKACDGIAQVVRVDARDNEGYTALQRLARE
ncbi:hypothetical protein TKK_0017971 [Trichogramma kaykai]